VHFSEESRNQPPSIVPWIAMINCDTNGTDYSLEDDIFTLCRDQGAQAALLYSSTSHVSRVVRWSLGAVCRCWGRAEGSAERREKRASLVCLPVEQRSRLSPARLAILLSRGASGSSRFRSLLEER
jgi:hypothetical protein